MEENEVVAVEMTVNGSRHACAVDPRCTLADVLRDELGLTGTHLGCEHGVCGACTVLVDGRSARACLMLIGQAEGTQVRTIEGLSEADGLDHPVQQGFRDRHAFQCGFCTPGFTMAAVELLTDNASPSAAQVREALSGNVCRCTGYQSIVEGVLRAAELQ